MGPVGQPYEAIRLNGVPWGHGALSNPIDAYGADPMEFYGSTGLRNSPLEPYGPPWGPFNSQLAFLCRPSTIWSGDILVRQAEQTCRGNADCDPEYNSCEKR